MNTKSMRRKKSSLSEVKVAVIGAPGVGKSALSVRFLTRRYIGEYDHQSETRYKHEVLVDNEPILYEILDTCPKIDAVTGKSETFGSLKQRCVRVALGMESRGVKSEHYVTLCSKNTLDSVIPWIATTFLGAKIGALDPNLSPRDMKHLLTLAGPRIIFVEESSLRLIEQSLEGTDMSTEIVVLGSSSKYSTLAEFLKPSKSESVFRPRGADPDEVGIVFFSSGTTGLPKGICWSHRNVVQAFQCLGECNMDCRAVLYFSTLYWVSAVGLLVDSFSVGGYRVLISQFDAETTFKAIDNYKITFIFAAPGILTELANFIVAGRYNTKSLKNFLTGGTPIPPEKLLKARETLKDTNVTVCYGMTEFGFTSLYDKQDGIFKNKPRSCGKLIPGVSLKVVDLETHQCLGPNQSGEIRLKSGFMMVGYLRQDFTNAFDEEGYLKTGDVRYYDEDECLYVVDRIKDMFKYKAWHIVPSSLESVLLQHPDVKEAIVYGIPHEEHGDLPAACVVLKDRSTATDEEVKIFFNKRVLEREHLIGGLKFLKQIPKTPTGKVMRKELRNSMIKSN